jgi:predicted dehydrogenase
MKRFAPAYTRTKELLQASSFGPPTLAGFTFMMGDFRAPVDVLVTDNSVHHLDLARFLLGDIEDLQARLGHSHGGVHALSVQGRATCGALVTLTLGSVGSWTHHNESVDIYGTGAQVLVSNLDTVELRVDGQPAQRWQPNYTVPLPDRSTMTTTGFLPELEHFERVVRQGEPCRSDLASAARTLRLAERIVQLVQ